MLKLTMFLRNSLYSLLIIFSFFVLSCGSNTDTVSTDIAIAEMDSDTENVVKSIEFMTKACDDALELERDYEKYYQLIADNNHKPMIEVIALIKNASDTDPSNKEFFTLSVSTRAYEEVQRMALESLESGDELKATELIVLNLESWKKVIDFCENWTSETILVD
jgi:hypothetical protein